MSYDHPERPSILALMELHRASHRQKQLSVLGASTLAFTICFAVWVMFSIIGIPIKERLGLSETEFGLLAALPILTGSLIRLPLGMLTDKLGGRIVFSVLMLLCIAPLWMITYAKVYAVALAVTTLLFVLLTHSDPAHKVSKGVTVKAQLRALKDIRVWEYSQHYAIVFGGYVALSLWMTKYYINEYGFGIATAALIATIFVLPSGMLRAVGGWLSDRFGAKAVTSSIIWVSWVCLLLLSIPKLLHWTVFTALLFVVGLMWAFGKASAFKHIADDYPDRIGVISGVVGLVGGLGGFVFPILFGVLVDLTGVRSSAFMLLFVVTSVSVVWLHLGERKRRRAVVLARSEEQCLQTQTY